MPENNKRQSLLTGAGILAIATIIVKLIGAVYKLPITNLIGTEGYGYFNGAYAVYTPVYAVSMAGLPVAVSKLVSQNMQLGRIKDARAIFKISQKMFFAVGLTGTLVLMAIAVPYSKYVAEAPMNYISMLAVAPCVLFCCLMSSYRGYYEGLNNMTPTGVSQVIEAAVKLVFGLAASYVFMTGTVSYYESNAVNGAMTLFGQQVSNRAEAMAVIYPYAAAVAILGVTLGSAFGLLYLVIRAKRKGFGFTREELVNSPPAESGKAIAKKLLMFAIPVAASSLVLNITNLIDDITIRNRLAEALSTDLETVKSIYSYALEFENTLDKNIGTFLYGMHGSVINVKNLIPTITLTLGISAIPVLSKAWTANDKKAVKTCIESALRIAMLIAMPAGFGIAALAQPILHLLYGSENPYFAAAASFQLTVYGLGMALYSMASPLTSMLQAVGKTKVPIVSMLLGGVLKIILNFILIATPSVNIKGACLSSTCCYIVMVGINLVMLLKETGVRINFVSVFLKPMIAGLVCGGAAWGCQYLLYSVLGIESRLTTIVSVGCGAVFYAVTILLIKGIAKDDVEMLPKGEKIAKVLAKFGLLG
ncbi:MAG: polysaccharide biosynthesis protein [Clostridia bacterium]|nr:polysaccharide biosynthesis protein [Clostridia bacterium]